MTSFIFSGQSEGDTSLDQSLSPTGKLFRSRTSVSILHSVISDLIWNISINKVGEWSLAIVVVPGVRGCSEGEGEGCAQWSRALTLDHRLFRCCGDGTPLKTNMVAQVASKGSFVSLCCLGFPILMIGWLYAREVFSALLEVHKCHILTVTTQVDWGYTNWSDPLPISADREIV